MFRPTTGHDDNVSGPILKASGYLTLLPATLSPRRVAIGHGYYLMMHAGDAMFGARLLWEGPPIELGTTTKIEMIFVAPDFARSFVEPGCVLECGDPVARIGEVRIERLWQA